MKRQDIQGIRAIAILLVLAYHVYPFSVPNGYIGVDMFFVISGYLIARMLSKSANVLSTTVIFDFYIRRFKRILPLFYFVVFNSLVYLLWTQTLPFMYKKRNYKFSKRTVFLLSNWRSNDEEDSYEKQLTGDHVVLAHCWSLCLEMQFYLITPFLVAAVNKFQGKRRLLVIRIMIALSCIHFLHATERINFNCPLARLWQFAMGFLAFYNEMEEVAYSDSSNENKVSLESAPLVKACGDEASDDNSNLIEQRRQFFKIGSYIALSLLLMTIYTWKLPQTLLRLIITPTTAALIYCGVCCQNAILTNKLLTYIGDISYSLYLVHWPIHCFVGYYINNHLFKVLPSTEIIIVLSIVSAIILHHCLEMPLQRTSIKLNTAFVLIFFIGSVFLTSGYFKNIELFRSLNNKFAMRNLDEHFRIAIRENLELVRYDGLLRHTIVFNCENTKFAGIKGEPCVHKNGTGNLTVLVTGNSYVGNHGDLIIKHLSPYASNITTYWKKGCEVISPSLGNMCEEEYDPKQLELIKRLRPDVLILATRAFVMNRAIRAPNVYDDDIFQFMWSRTRQLQEWTKRIYILGPNPDSPISPATVYLEALRSGKHLIQVKSNINKLQTAFRQRLRLLVELCPICEVYEWEHLFYNKTTNTSQFFDARHDFMYFDDHIHLGKHGIAKIEPIYKDLAEKIQRNFTR